MNEIMRLNTSLSPRQVIRLDFMKDLPISGGWGYDLESACIINQNDPKVNKKKPFDGIAIEKSFVEKRIYEEMIVLRDPGEQYSGISWNLIEQSLINKDDRYFDKLIYEVIGFEQEIWNELQSRYDEIMKNGAEELIPELDAYSEEKKHTLICEFYFDITSFYGK